MKKRFIGIITAVLLMMTSVPINVTASTVTTTKTTTNSKEVVISTNPNGSPVISSVPAEAWKHETRTFTFEETKSVTSDYDLASGKVIKDNSIFPSTYHIDKDGYKGDISLKSISWEDNLITNRTEEKTEVQTITVYDGDAIPSSKTINVADPITGKNATVQLDKASVKVVTSGKDKIITEDIGYFRWFSNNATTYPGMGGDWAKYSNAPDRNETYYGTLFPKDRGKDLHEDYHISNIWAWDRVYSAKECYGTAKGSGIISIVKNGSDYYWNTNTHDHYGRGVTQRYEFPTSSKSYTVYSVTYKGIAHYEDYVASSRGTAYYKGDLTKNVAVIDATMDSDIDNQKIVK